MADVGTVGAILTSIKTATDLARLIKDSGSSLQEAEVKLKLAELIGALADAKIEIADVQNEVLAKEQAIQELTEAVPYRKR